MLALTANSVSTSAVITDSRWHHLTYVYTGLSFLLYVDGQLNLVANATQFWAWQANWNITLGTSWDPFWYKFNGYMDYVRMYNYALSPMQIYQPLFNGGRKALFQSTDLPKGARVQRATQVVQVALVHSTLSVLHAMGGTY